VFGSIVRALVITIALLVGAGAAAQAAEARTASCLAPATGVTCHVWTGKVTFMGDGDTLYVDIAHDGLRSSLPVRITGINATEQTVYSNVASQRRGECHALEATARLEQLLQRNRFRVRLYAIDPESRSGNRLKRVVATKVRGRWRDLGRILVSEGHAVWLPGQREYAWNVDYERRAERASRRQLGIWNPTYCGAGPSDASPLKVTVNGDVSFLSDEWVRIRNLDPVNEVPLGGWWVRDSALNKFVFPDWATLPGGESLTLYVGEGADTWTEFYWQRRKPVFGNIGPYGDGDSAFLVDPQGDVRAWMTYPCVTQCTDPYQGMLKVSAKPRGREYVTVSNVGSITVDLDGYQLRSPPYSYPFPPRDSILEPGEQMRIWTGGDPGEDTRLEKHWGETGAFLNNGGDRVRLASLRGVVLDCYAYGTGTC
jgi:endonuclease YncB( thermonuclease family)